MQHKKLVSKKTEKKKKQRKKKAGKARLAACYVTSRSKARPDAAPKKKGGRFPCRPKRQPISADAIGTPYLKST
jgi:hypothetical protein